MRISHSSKFIFLATPRTGSTTVRSILDQHSDIKSVHISEITDEFPFYHHISALELKKIFDQRDWSWESYKRFCVVRNPYDRVVSLYHHHLKTRKSLLVKGGVGAKMKKALSAMRLAPSFRDYVMRIDPKSRLTTSLEHFLCDTDGRFLVEDVLMFERLVDELPNYLNGMGIPITAEEIPHLNSSENRDDYRGYYDEETKIRVSKLYKYEVERFGYSF